MRSCARCGTTTADDAACLVCGAPPGAPASEPTAAEVAEAAGADAPLVAVVQRVRAEPDPTARKRKVTRPTTSTSATSSPATAPSASSAPAPIRTVSATGTASTWPSWWLLAVALGSGATVLVALGAMGESAANRNWKDLWYRLYPDLAWAGGWVAIVLLGAAVAGRARPWRDRFGVSVLAATPVLVVWYAPKWASVFSGRIADILPIDVVGGAANLPDGPVLWLIVVLAIGATGFMSGLLSWALSRRSSAIGTGVAIAALSGALATVATLVDQRSSYRGAFDASTAYDVLRSGRVVFAMARGAYLEGYDLTAEDLWPQVAPLLLALVGAVVAVRRLAARDAVDGVAVGTTTHAFATVAPTTTAATGATAPAPAARPTTTTTTTTTKPSGTTGDSTTGGGLKGTLGKPRPPA